MYVWVRIYTPTHTPIDTHAYIHIYRSIDKNRHMYRCIHTQIDTKNDV